MNRSKLFTILTSAVLIIIYSGNIANAAVPKTFKFVGSGYGHGVGLSQIGAKGQALEGKSATEILNYYFPGTSVVAVADTQTIRVNTAHQIDNVSFTVIKETSTAQGTFTLASDTNTPVIINNSAKFSIESKLIAVQAKNLNLASSGLWTINIETGTYLVQNINGTTLKLKYGTVQLRAVPVTGKGFHIEITDSMRLHDEYLYGISEVPSMWPSAALQSQIIAARTYALSRMDSIKPSCDCNIYSSKYDQVYGGYTKELEPKYGAIWHQNVDATTVDTQSALAITFNGAPINVYFSSSSGGQTQRAIDVWGTDIPYLTSVPDPWSLDPKLNPKYYKWVRVISQEKMAQAFSLPDVKKYVINSRSKTGSVLKITAYSSAGVKSTLAVGTFKTAVKLPSSWFNQPPTITLEDSSTVTN